MYRLNLEIKPLIDVRRQILSIESLTPAYLTQTAFYARDATVRRTMEKGQNALGQRMITKSKKRLGRYSRSHGKKRLKKGLIIDRITLSFNGAMMRAFQVKSIKDPKSVTVGFVDSRADEIATYNEERFGPVFTLSNSERQTSADFFVRKFGNFFT